MNNIGRLADRCFQVYLQHILTINFPGLFEYYRDNCQCGYPKTTHGMHSQSSDSISSQQPANWGIYVNTKQSPTNAFGEIDFVNEEENIAKVNQFRMDDLVMIQSLSIIETFPYSKKIKQLEQNIWCNLKAEESMLLPNLHSQKYSIEFKF